MPPVSLAVIHSCGPFALASAMPPVNNANIRPSAAEIESFRRIANGPPTPPSRTARKLKGSGTELKAACVHPCPLGAAGCLSQHRVGACHHADRSLVGGADHHDAAEACIAADA